MRYMLLAVIVSSAVAGCSSQPYVERTAVDLPPSPRSSMLVSTNWLADHLSDPNLAILHVAHSRLGYDQGHIEGARFVDWSDISQVRDGVENELPPLADLVQLVRRLGIHNNSRIVIYDEQLGISAARAYLTLDYLGLGDQAALLNGQLATWKAEGRPLSTSPPVVRTSDFVPRPRPEVIVHLQQCVTWCRRKTTAWTCGSPSSMLAHPRITPAPIPARELRAAGIFPGPSTFSVTTLYWTRRNRCCVRRTSSVSSIHNLIFNRTSR
ncbi:MAG: hypothetical protein GXY44_12990 [Phycisphaerales bacterium]|nr:hypothetical protein [Phycisphaerales bacterium]